jgi:hypothetical protein
MATFVMLATLTPEGVRTVKSNPEPIREVEQLGITVREQWATLGEFDFVSIVEALDNARWQGCQSSLVRAAPPLPLLPRDSGRRLHRIAVTGNSYADEPARGREQQG